MKDKLVKTGHKKPFYLFKRIFIGFSCIIGASIIIALPLSFGLRQIQETETIVENQNILDENF